MLDICFLRFKWKIANIFARLWKSAHFCHWAIFPCSAANFRPADRWNRKSQIIPKFVRILKFKPQQCYKLIKTLLQTENEGRLGFKLWPRFARFFCAFALNGLVCHHEFRVARTWRAPFFLLALTIFSFRLSFERQSWGSNSNTKRWNNTWQIYRKIKGRTSYLEWLAANTSWRQQEPPQLRDQQ